jgi:hypothetical protein
MLQSKKEKLKELKQRYMSLSCDSIESGISSNHDSSRLRSESAPNNSDWAKSEIDPFVVPNEPWWGTKLAEKLSGSIAAETNPEPTQPRAATNPNPVEVSLRESLPSRGANDLKSILKKCVNGVLLDQIYRGDKVTDLCATVTASILAALSAQSPQCRLIVQTMITKPETIGLHIHTSCLWDRYMDNCSVFNWKSRTFSCIVMIYQIQFNEV